MVTGRLRSWSSNRSIDCGFRRSGPQNPEQQTTLAIDVQLAVICDQHDSSHRFRSTGMLNPNILITVDAAGITREYPQCLDVSARSKRSATMTPCIRPQWDKNAITPSRFPNYLGPCRNFTASVVNQVATTDLGSGFLLGRDSVTGPIHGAFGISDFGC